MADPNASEIAAAIERAGAAWTAGENDISALPEEERYRRLGVPLDQLPAEGDEQVGSVVTGPALPASFDLRNVNGKNYVTKPVRDQGNCGSCVAFGSIATVEGSACFKLGKSPTHFDLSEADLFYCQGGPGVNCNTGWLPSRAIPHCQNPGVVDEACFPYTAGNQACRLCADAAKRRFRIKSFTALTSQVQSIKTWITQSGPVVGCFVVYQDFFNYKSGVYTHVTGGQAGGHCISIIGFDDRQSCWICKNSWGPGWGDHGYFRIRYNECRIDSWENFGVTV